jgi:membrane-associated protein
MDSFFEQVKDILKVLFNGKELMETLGRDGYMVASFVVLNLIIFTETGLLIGFCLPGDSLLVTAGLACYHAGWNLPLLLVTLCAAAIVGDSVGYYIGYKTGPKLFQREKSWLFKKDHLLKAQAFYERHGGKTIILARFMPIVRTFAPIVAGVARMDYKRFVMFNVVGGIGWVISMVLLGYGLTPVLDPVLQSAFGKDIQIRDHIEKLVILVVFLSISPGIYHWLKARKATPAEPQKAKESLVA